MKAVSIIVPVRRDSPWIGTLLESIRVNADDLGNLEVLLGIAHDDTETNPPDSFVRTIRLDQRLRKWGVGFYTNILALDAEGTLIWWLSDEVVIQTTGFDSLLVGVAESYGDKIYKFIPSGDEGGGAAYPILTKKWIDITKRWADTPSIDSWVNTVCGSLPRRGMDLSDLRIRDRRVMGEITDEESLAHALQPEVEIRHEDYAWGGPKVMAEIQKDVDSLIRAIAVQGL